MPLPDGYTEILEEKHYYPFGMEMDGPWRTPQGFFNDDFHGYNGKELVSDGRIEWMPYGARFYDAQLGRFTGVDPLASDFASWSTYSYTFNNPIRFIDPDGRAPEDIIIIGNAQYQKQIMSALVNLAASSDAGFQLVQNAISSDRDLVIADTRGDVANHVRNFNDNYSTLAFDIGQATTNLDADNGANGQPLENTVEVALAHELAHFENGLNQPGGSVLIDGDGYSTGIPADEPHAVEMENRVRADKGIGLRTHYGGLNVAGKEAVQSGKSPMGFAMRPHGRTHQKSGYSDNAYSYIFGNIGAKTEHRRNYLIGGVGINRYLKPGASSNQTRLYDKEKK